MHGLCRIAIFWNSIGTKGIGYSFILTNWFSKTVSQDLLNLLALSLIDPFPRLKDVGHFQVWMCPGRWRVFTGNCADWPGFINSKELAVQSTRLAISWIRG